MVMGHGYEDGHGDAVRGGGGLWVWYEDRA